MKKSKTKVLAWVLSGVIISSISIYGTISYLTNEDTIVNTLTVGGVDIDLDEALVTPNGIEVEGAKRVKENKYHLIPGRTYTKDPTLTVKKGSKESYVRIMVTINKVSQLKSILGNDLKLDNYILGWDSKVWKYAGSKEDINDTITYEFRYFESVKPTKNNQDLVLEPLFDFITIPGEITNKDLETMGDFEITVIGHAIQKQGFDTEDMAWEAFDSKDKVKE